jgi:hypothetical protein
MTTSSFQGRQQVVTKKDCLLTKTFESFALFVANTFPNIKFAMEKFMLSSSRVRVAIMAVAAVVVAACGGSSGGFSGDVASLRVLHAVSDAPRVNIYLNDDEVLSDVDFRTGSPFLPVTAGTYDIRVEAIVPGGNVDVITANGVELAADTATTIIATGDVSEGDIAPVAVVEPTAEIAAGNLRLRVTHGSFEAPPVYIALTTPGAPIDQAALLGPLSFRETTDALEVPAGDYQVRVTAKAQPVTDADVLYDSGPLSLGEGADLHVVAVTSTVPSTAESGSPISLVALDGSGAGDIFDVNTGSNLTIVHDAPGVPAVDVFADVTATPEVEEIQLTNDLVYGNFEPRQVVPSTEFAVGVRLASDNSADAFGFTADLMSGMGYTAIARLVDGIPEAQVLVDDYRSVATEAKVRIVHGSPSAGPVDVYVFPSDEANPPTPASGDPLLESFAYGAETGFVSLPAGSYDVLVALEGTETVAITVRGLAVDAGGVYTAIARDPAPEQSEFGVILIAD